MDKISVIVAVYNAEHTIKKCVNSLLNQTYNKIEIILVDDCSNDCSYEICKSYSQKFQNVIAVSQNNNIGVSATRNQGIAVATGDYVCFVDSDDYVEPTYLELLHEYFIRYQTIPICGFVFHNEYEGLQPVKYVWRQNEEIVSIGDAFDLLDYVYLGALWNKLFSSKVINDNRICFDEKMSMGEDLKFTLDYIVASNLNTVFAFSDCLYHYMRLNNTSLMSQYDNTSYQENYYRIFQLIDPYNVDAKQIYEEHCVKAKRNIKYRVLRDKTLNYNTKYDKIHELFASYTRWELMMDQMTVFKEAFVTKIIRIRKKIRYRGMHDL